MQRQPPHDGDAVRHGGSLEWVATLDHLGAVHAQGFDQFLCFNHGEIVHKTTSVTVTSTNRRFVDVQAPATCPKCL